MLFPAVTAQEKRSDLRTKLQSGKLLQFPGAFAPIVAQSIESMGFDGVYISGAVLSNDLGLPDIGLTTQTEVASRAKAIARITKLPSIVDIDTGFGEPLNAARTVQELEDCGLCGCHLEDQMNPKRCGHLDNKQLVTPQEMAMKVRAAAEARRDKNFLIIARTDARASEGLDAAVNRAKRYVDAGAEMIFPEALKDEKEFEAFRKAVDVPLLANMTEFGKSPLLDKETLEGLGFNIVIYPVTTLRLAMGAVERGLKQIKEKGTQQDLLDQMQTRKRLYEVVQYESYNDFDSSIFNFKLEGDA
ncbi:MAG: methylisocitrate lyase [Bdellovibrionales bacterium]|nr:methylisocitrate lyase [Bdellovibrionales bacterium]